MRTEELLLSEFLASHPSDAARLLERYRPEDAGYVLDQVPAEAAAATLSEMSRHRAADCLGAIAPVSAGRILTVIPAPAAASLLRRVDRESRDRILEAMQAAEPLRRLLRYPEDAIGSAVDLTVPVLPEGLTVAEATDLLRQGRHSASQWVYLVDKEQKLRGAVSLSGLMAGEHSALLRSDRLRSDPPSLPASAPIRAVVQHPGWDDFDELPVIERDGVFVGALHHRAVRGLARQGGSGGLAGLDAALGLAEAFWVGMYGMLEGVSSTLIRHADTRSIQGEKRHD